MASLVAFSEKKRLKISKTFEVLDLKFSEQMPAHFFTAMQNAIRLELQTEKNLKTILSRKSLKKQKGEKTRKITFGDVTAHKKGEIVEGKISFETGRTEMISTPIIEKFLGADYGLISIISDNPKRWGAYALGTSYSLLLQEAEDRDISMDDIKIDLKKIYDYFRRDTAAVLGYRSSFKIKHQYKEQKYNSFKQKWEETGRTLLRAPNLRFYLIKVVKDENFSATVIQTAWRQHRDKKVLKALKCFKILMKFLSNNA